MDTFLQRIQNEEEHIALLIELLTLLQDSGLKWSPEKAQNNEN